MEPSLDHVKIIVMDYRLRVVSPQLLPDRAVKLLQSIIESADGRLGRRFPGSWISALFPLDPHCVRVMDDRPGGDLDPWASQKPELLASQSHSVVCLVECLPALLLVLAAGESFGMMA
ncbi:hypothetical protein DLJ47_31615 [Micromonospora sp. S4605]|nr:hypothetical protein DLJ47_31615 [Micromonospora sp. S4605]